MAQEHDKAELIAELARARTIVSANFLALRHDLDFPARARKAFKSSPLPWLAAAGIIGLLLARLPRRTKKPEVTLPRFRKKEEPIEKAGKAGLLLGAMKIAFDFARPVLLKWITQKYADYSSSAAAQPRNYPRS